MGGPHWHITSSLQIFLKIMPVDTYPSLAETPLEAQSFVLEQVQIHDRHWAFRGTVLS